MRPDRALVKRHHRPERKHPLARMDRSADPPAPMAARSAEGPSSARPRDAARAVFRRAILDAAEAIFAEKGFHSARIQDVAERAQIAVGTVYNHFAQKEDVLLALFEERMRDLHAELVAEPGAPEAFELRLEHRLTRMLGFVDRHRAFFAVASEHGLTSQRPASATAAIYGDARPFEQIERDFRALVRAGLEERVLRGDERTLARLLGATIQAVVFAAVEDGRARVVDEAARIAALFLHGAVGRPGEPRPRARPARRKRATS